MINNIWLTWGDVFNESLKTLWWSFVQFAPKLIVAVVLIIAAIVSEALSKTVLAMAKAVSLRSAHMLAAIAKYAVWVFAIIIALGKLGLGDYMSILFSGIVAMLALAGALAFGLGAKDETARFIAKLGSEVSER